MGNFNKWSRNDTQGSGPSVAVHMVDGEKVRLFLTRKTEDELRTEYGAGVKLTFSQPYDNAELSNRLLVEMVKRRGELHPLEVPVLAAKLAFDGELKDADYEAALATAMSGSGSLKVAMLVSRNKDNRNVDGHEERRRTFLTNRSQPEMVAELNSFAEAGRDGEMSRLYMSVNARDVNKTTLEMAKYLLESPDYDLMKLPTKLAAFAAKKENAAETNWLFDYDDVSWNLDDFLAEVKQLAPKGTNVMVHKTPNGHAVVVDRRFDTRQLVQDYDVELKRDDMLCCAWRTKELELDLQPEGPVL